MFHINETQKKYELPETQNDLKLCLYVDDKNYMIKIGDGEAIDTGIAKCPDPKGSVFVQRLKLKIGEEVIKEYRGKIEGLKYEYKGEPQEHVVPISIPKKYIFLLNKSFKHCSIHKLFDMIDNLIPSKYEIEQRDSVWNKIFD